ncbi:Uncharacterised protein [Escherichia coli]|nr:Uncharacterised protein [Escherichia coli]
MSHRIQDPVQPFSYRFRSVFHHGNVTVSRQRQPSLPVTPPFLAPWPVPDILCQLFQRPALARQLHLCTQPHQLFLPGFSHPLITVLPQEAGSFCLASAFNREVRMFILTGFINYLAQLLRHMEAVKGDFLNRAG